MEIHAVILATSKATENLNFTQLTAWHFASYERQLDTDINKPNKEGKSSVMAHVLATANHSQETYNEVKSMLRGFCKQEPTKFPSGNFLRIHATKIESHVTPT